jgi:LCP family protein required for cell wall assembly
MSDAPSSPDLPAGWLQVRAPGAPERRFDLVRFPVHVGRGPESDLQLDDAFVSAEHAEIGLSGDRLWVRDLGSTNGTRLNDRSLQPRTPVPLQDGDQLRLGASTLLYRANGRSAVAPRESEQVAETQTPGPVPLLVETQRASWPGRLLRAVLTLGLVLGLFLLLLAALAWVLAPPRLSLLLLGSDARPDEIRRGEVGRTDTLLTVVVDRPPGGSSLISVPRDLWLPIPGFGEARINTAYALGGPTTSKRAVGDLLGLGVDRYLLVGLQGVRDVVDAAGGVDIDVPTAIHDDAYPTDDYRTLVVDIPAGRQHMDGETALRYVRTRHQDSDFGRIGRQQLLVQALARGMLQPIRWWRLPAVVAATVRATRTDLGPLDLVPLALALVANGEPEHLVLGPGLVEGFVGADGAALLRPTPDLRRAVNLLLWPKTARVEVLNASSSEGVARRAADQLRADGFETVRYAAATSSASTASIEVRPGAARAARRVSALLDLSPSAIHEASSLVPDIDVRVTLTGPGR